MGWISDMTGRGWEVFTSDVVKVGGVSDIVKVGGVNPLYFIYLRIINWYSPTAQ